MNKNLQNITVIGAGHGGKTMAAEMASRGFNVTIYNRTHQKIAVINLQGGIDLKTEDGRDVFAPIQKATSDIEEALADAQLIMVVVPAFAHRAIAQQAAPYLRDDQVVVLNPGRTGGALEFQQVLNEARGERPANSHPVICEAETFLFAARSLGPAQARIFRTKFSVPVAAFPATFTERALGMLRQVYHQFIPAPNVLHTSLNNMGAIFHPALTLLNAGWIETTGGNFEFYMDGVTPATARVLTNLDRERVTVGAAVGIRAQTASDWLERAYAARGDNLYEAMHANEGYAGIKAPTHLQHRYIFEDVPCSLIPIAEIGRQYGVDTPCTHAIVSLANIIHATDYWPKGRTLKNLGIEGMSVAELHHYVETGER